jgi:hypothetical protein
MSPIIAGAIIGGIIIVVLAAFDAVESRRKR